MATAGEAIYRTDVFASQNEQRITTTTDWADVFARRERREAGMPLLEPHWLTVRLMVDGGPVELSYMSFGDGLPAWADPVLESLAERWGTRQGWDSYHAKPTNRQLVVRLLNVLSELMRDDSRPPQITPLADGGVQAEWHDGRQDLEIVVRADEEPTYYYFDHDTGAEEEKDLESSYARVQDLIGELS